MVSPSAEDELRAIVDTVVAAHGCELWDMSLAGPRGRRRLAVFIERPGGVDLESCARVSRALATALEASGFSMADVDLEVSSPGAERRLRGIDDYRRFVGNRVHVRYRSGQSERVLEGRLSRVVDDALAVADGEGQVHEVPLAALLSARLAVDFGGRR